MLIHGLVFYYAAENGRTLLPRENAHKHKLKKADTLALFLASITKQVAGTNESIVPVTLHFRNAPMAYKKTRVQLKSVFDQAVFLDPLNTIFVLVHRR